MTPERAAKEAHYTAVKEIVGINPNTGGLSKEDFEVYNKFVGTPERVAAKIFEAREAGNIKKGE